MIIYTGIFRGGGGRKKNKPSLRGVWILSGNPHPNAMHCPIFIHYSIVNVHGQLGHLQLELVDSLWPLHTNIYVQVKLEKPMDTIS